MSPTPFTLTLQVYPAPPEPGDYLFFYIGPFFPDYVSEKRNLQFCVNVISLDDRDFQAYASPDRSPPCRGLWVSLKDLHGLLPAAWAASIMGWVHRDKHYGWAMEASTVLRRIQRHIPREYWDMAVAEYDRVHPGLRLAALAKKEKA
jgi:hypothetical protein